jgi:chromosome segregation ATPase
MEIIERAEAYDRNIAEAIADAQRLEVSRDEAAAERDEVRAKLPAALDALQAADRARAAAQTRFETLNAEYRVLEDAVERRRLLIDQREHDMMEARRRAEELVAGRQAMEAELAEAKAKVERVTARREAFKAAQADPLADHPKGCRCDPCQERAKVVNVSPIKIDFTKGALGMNGAIQVRKAEAVQKFQTKMREVVEEREGVKIAPPPESMP